MKRAQAKHSLTFPLLSDEGSKTIEAYGILNKDAAGQAKGIPYPMTFVVELVLRLDPELARKLWVARTRDRWTSRAGH